MNWALEEAMVKRYHHDSQDRLRAYLATFVDTSIYADSLKAL